MTGLEFKTSIKIYCLSHKIDIDSIGYLCCNRKREENGEEYFETLFGVWDDEIKKLVFIPSWAEKEYKDFTWAYDYRNILQVIRETPDDIEIKFTTYYNDTINPKKFEVDNLANILSISEED